MDSSDKNNKLVEFDRLNSVGKVVFLAGTVYKAAEQIADYTLSSLSAVWDEAEKAFTDGLSDAVDDAVIIDETPRGPSNDGKARDKGKNPS